MDNIAALSGHLTEFITHGDCPGCRQPMRVREMPQEDGAVVVDELCATCDHYDVYELEGREDACRS